MTAGEAVARPGFTPASNRTKAGIRKLRGTCMCSSFRDERQNTPEVAEPAASACQICCIKVFNATASRGLNQSWEAACPASGLDRRPQQLLERLHILHQSLAALLGNAVNGLWLAHHESL